MKTEYRYHLRVDGATPEMRRVYRILRTQFGFDRNDANLIAWGVALATSREMVSMHRHA